jgi:hypothetical protein
MISIKKPMYVACEQHPILNGIDVPSIRRWNRDPA